MTQSPRDIDREALEAQPRNLPRQDQSDTSDKTSTNSKEIRITDVLPVESFRFATMEGCGELEVVGQAGG